MTNYCYNVNSTNNKIMTNNNINDEVITIKKKIDN